MQLSYIPFYFCHQIPKYNIFGARLQEANKTIKFRNDLKRIMTEMCDVNVLNEGWAWPQKLLLFSLNSAIRHQSLYRRSYAFLRGVEHVRSTPHTVAMKIFVCVIKSILIDLTFTLMLYPLIIEPKLSTKLDFWDSFHDIIFFLPIDVKYVLHRNSVIYRFELNLPVKIDSLIKIESALLSIYVEIPLNNIVYYFWAHIEIQTWIWCVKYSFMIIVGNHQKS